MNIRENINRSKGVEAGFVRVKRPKVQFLLLSKLVSGMVGAYFIQLWTPLTPNVNGTNLNNSLDVTYELCSWELKDDKEGGSHFTAGKQLSMLLAEKNHSANTKSH